MQSPGATPPKGMDWLLGFARRRCVGAKGRMAAMAVEGCLTQELKQAQRQKGYSGNIQQIAGVPCSQNCHCFLDRVRL